MSTTGIVIGKFAPLHNGHINMINWAATQVDKLIVVMSYDQKWVDQQPEWLQDKLSWRNRVRWLKTVFNDTPHVEIKWMDESGCRPYPHGWDEWEMLLRKTTQFETTLPSVFFGSEPSDATEYEARFPGSKYVVYDEVRSNINISATRVRGNVFENWEYIPSIVRADFALRVCVIGTESCGKTTLVKYLAKRFNTSWIEEYGRRFVEQDLMGDESLLEPWHYPLIAYHQKVEEYHELRRCNRILLVDTNAMITSLFHKMYEDRTDLIVEQIAAHERYDVILDCQPDVPWVDDGMRSNGTTTKRSRARAMLDEELQQAGLTSDPCYYKIQGSYKERLEQSIEIINQKLK